MIISDLNLLEAVEGADVVGGINLGNESSWVYANEYIKIKKDVYSDVYVKGNLATAEAEAKGKDSLTQTFAFTTSDSSSSTSIAASN